MSFIFSHRLFATACKAPTVFVESSQVHHRVRGFILRPGRYWTRTSFASKARYSSAAIKMETVDTSSRISELRKLMKERNIDVYGTTCLSSECVIGFWRMLPSHANYLRFKLYLPKTATLLSILHPVMLGGNSSAASAGQQDVLLSHRIRRRWQQTADTSTRRQSSWTTTGPC